MRYSLGEMVDIPYGTNVEVRYDGENSPPLKGIVVGKASTGLDQSHIVKCTDGTIPNVAYHYDTCMAPLPLITILDE